MAATPGNQHTFGVSMVERFLSAAGWTVQTEMSGDLHAIVDAAKGHWFAIAGLTAGSDSQIGSLTSTIAALRHRSRNTQIKIMVGGPMFTANPDLAIEVGADATAVNAPAAVLVAQKLFDLVELEGRSRTEAPFC
jgi:methanogenic corrinoid protein MtbC1